MQVFLGLKTRIIHLEYFVVAWAKTVCLSSSVRGISSVLLSPNKADEKTIFVPQCTESRPKSRPSMNR